MTIEEILVYLILIPLIMVNILFSFGSFFQKRTVISLQKRLKVEEEFKDSRDKIFNIVHLIIWITIGAINVFNLDNLISLGSILVFIAFRGGSTLSRRFIFGIHDIKLMKSHLSNNKIAKIVSLAVKIGIIIELLFLLIWGISYKYLNVSIKSNFGLDVNILVIILWIFGFIYGFIFSVIQSSFTKHFLLKNEIGIVLLLSGEAFKEKVKTKVSLPKFFKL